MSVSWKTSNQNYDVIIPVTQQEILSINQDLVPNRFGSYAPVRNNHVFSVLFCDGYHDFYFSPNYDYNRDSIAEYEQVVIINDGGGGGGSSDSDRYSIYLVDNNDKKLHINYNI